MVIIKRVLSIAALVGIAVATMAAQSPDPLLGTWKLNAAKSKAPYASGTTVFEGTGDTLKGTVDLVGTDGTKFHWTFSAKYDGKDHPATGSSPFGGAPDRNTRTTTAQGTDAKGQPVASMSFYEKQ